jgi:DNA mismatch repair protein MutH
LPADLLMRARALAGRTLQELAVAARIELPSEPGRAKGHIGRLLERSLGVLAEAGALTDFPGCELKTLPVNASGRPCESTFVCHVPLKQLSEVSWEASRVRAKLAHVLFVPVEAARGVTHAQRRVGSAFLWRMSAEHEALLCEDYGVIADCVASGDVERLDARLGRALQVRPKAAHAGVRVRAFGPDDTPLAVLPRAFYLRATFTAALLRDALRLGATRS